MVGGGALILGFPTVASGSSRRGGVGDDEAPWSDLPDIEGGMLVTDRSEFPSEFHERPEFAEMVAAGTLPTVAERIGQDPLVLRPVHEIGRYGGTLRRAYIGVVDFQNANMFCAGPDSLLYWDAQRENVIPNVARGFELSDDARELILHLRRDMHWSDGAPFTADDIVFWRNDVSLNADLSSGAASLRVDGQEVAVEKIDDFTVCYLSPAPHPLLPALLASLTDIGGQTLQGRTGGGGFAPVHYLSQFHPAYTSQAEVDRLASDAGLNSWVELFRERNSWELNPDLPLVTPWLVTRPINDPPWEFSANPYSIWVDTEGNQLPYIAEITMDLTESIDVLVLRAGNGELDFQDRHLEVASFPVLIDNQERSDYTTHILPGEELDFGVRINLAYDADPVIGDLLRTVEFRRALSLAVDRDQINEAFFLGTSIPTATMASDTSPYFPGPEWRTRWATYDPEQANALLDELGLTTSGNGARQRPDGTGPLRLEYEAGPGFADFVGIGEMIGGQWADVGIALNVVATDGLIGNERANANELMLSGHGVGTDDPFLRADTFLPTVTNGFPGMIGIPYARWFASGGDEGVEPPPSLQLLKDAMELYYRGLQTPSEEERIEIAKELYMMHADEVWSIGCVGFGIGVYGMYLAKNGLRNVPARVRRTTHQRLIAPTLPMTFFYDE